jgi:hypothetical protein
MLPRSSKQPSKSNVAVDKDAITANKRHKPTAHIEGDASVVTASNSVVPSNSAQLQPPAAGHAVGQVGASSQAQGVGNYVTKVMAAAVVVLHQIHTKYNDILRY